MGRPLGRGRILLRAGSRRVPEDRRHVERRGRSPQHRRNPGQSRRVGRGRGPPARFAARLAGAQPSRLPGRLPFDARAGRASHRPLRRSTAPLRRGKIALSARRIAAAESLTSMPVSRNVASSWGIPSPPSRWRTARSAAPHRRQGWRAPCPWWSACAVTRCSSGGPCRRPAGVASEPRRSQNAARYFEMALTLHALIQLPVEGVDTAAGADHRERLAGRNVEN